ENDDINKKKKDHTGRPLEGEALQLVCENWTRRVSEFQKSASKPEESIQKKLTKVQKVNNDY
ncbi:9770_t:CDS:1, partial [Gigaspora rosea]